jgi:hypothetical protein
MSSDDGNSEATALVTAAPGSTVSLWKVPHSIADVQNPIEIKTTEFDSSFIPFEIEYGVVMDQLSKIYKSWKSTIREYIANAESVCMSASKMDPEYMPQINIDYNPGNCMLTIGDNGIGISKRVFTEVFRYFGRSRNGFDPTISGMFGLGAKSFVMLVGDKGSMVLHTKSRETGECYKMYARKVGFDVLPHEDRGYGTSFTFIHDPGFNQLEVLKAIGEFSRYVRVPVNLVLSGEPVRVANPGYATRSSVWDNTTPAELTLRPSGPTLISGVSPMVVLDKKIKEMTAKSQGYRSDEKAAEYVKVHYDTEHYEFWGMLRVDIEDGTLAARGSEHGTASLILISMPTEDVVMDVFSKAFVRIKSETGPTWLPKPTPDRERFEDTTRALFMEKLYMDLTERLPGLAGESLYYRSKGADPVPREFKGIGKIESYTDYFSLNTAQRAIWHGLYESNSFKNSIPQATRAILEGLYRDVEEWDATKTNRGYGRRHRSTGIRRMHEAIEKALDDETHIYIAPLEAKKSSLMRARCSSARSEGHIVLLSPALSAIPQALKQDIQVFHDLSEVQVQKVEKAMDRVTYHTVEISDKYSWDYKSKRSSVQKHIDNMTEIHRGGAVAFAGADNINEYISILEMPAHTCPVGLFKATKAQIQWFAGNSEILSLKEYVAWAKRQSLSTSKGRMTIGALVSEATSLFHSVGKEAGYRLLNALRSNEEMIYVPLVKEDYFKVAAVLHYDKLDAKRIIMDSKGLASHLGMGMERHDLGGTPDRTALIIYSKLMLEDVGDLSAISAVIDTTYLSNLTRLIDTIVRLRQTTPEYKSRSPKPEVLGFFENVVV